MPTPANLPLVQLPAVVIAPSTTFLGDKLNVSYSTYGLPFVLEPDPAIPQTPSTISANAARRSTAALTQATDLVQNAIATIREFVYLMKVPEPELLGQIEEAAIKLIQNNEVISQQVFANDGLVVTAYVVCTDNRFGFEYILSVQTFAGETVLIETRSRNASSQITFNGEVIYLNGVTLTGH